MEMASLGVPFLLYIQYFNHIRDESGEIKCEMYHKEYPLIKAIFSREMYRGSII